MPDIPKHESQTVEFKQTWSDTARKTLIAFANGMGGTLYFGIDDSGHVIGIDNRDSLSRTVRDFARQGVEPPLTDAIEIEFNQSAGKTVMAVRVASGNQKPYAFKGKRWDAGGIFVRIGSSTVAAKHEEIVSLVRMSDPRTWESRPALRQDLTFLQATEIFRGHQIPFSENHYLGMGLLDSDRYFTNLAYLLSDQNPTIVKVGYYDTPDSRFNRGIEAKGSILFQMTTLRALLEQLNAPNINKQTGKQEREERYPYPPLSLREALTNCIAHRDYDFVIDSSINVYNDRIVFLTIGGLPPEISLDEALLDGFHFCRNGRLADIFQRLHWMENFGTGFSDIFLGYANTGKEPICENNNRIFKICLPRLDIDDALETRILALLMSGKALSRQALETQLNSARSTTSKALKGLLDKGKIRKTGAGKSTRYIILPIT